MNNQEILETISWLTRTEKQNIEEYIKTLNKIPMGLTATWNDFAFLLELMQIILDARSKKEE